MKNISIFIGILLFLVPLVLAEQAGDPDLPEGMRVIQTGKAKLLVPEDARIIERDGFIKVEDTSEYAARKFLELRRRLEKLEAEQSGLSRQLQRLQGVVDDIRESERAVIQEPEDQSLKPEGVEQ